MEALEKHPWTNEIPARGTSFLFGETHSKQTLVCQMVTGVAEKSKVGKGQGVPGGEGVRLAVVRKGLTEWWHFDQRCKRRWGRSVLLSWGRTLQAKERAGAMVGQTKTWVDNFFSLVRILFLRIVLQVFKESYSVLSWFLTSSHSHFPFEWGFTHPRLYFPKKHSWFLSMSPFKHLS